MKILNALFIGILFTVLILATACTNSTVNNSGTASGTENIVPTANTSSSTPSTNTGVVKELRIEAFNFGFKVLNDVQINKGDTVRIILTSSSGTHGLSIPDFNINIGPVSVGETKTVDFIADKSGTFTYFCNVPCGSGHRSMKSTITVI